jgi:nitrogen-specific signal transduction histidine kinase
LKLDLDAEADRVLARVGQVKSVILNLMVNSLEAQPDGGWLEIHSELARGSDLGSPLVAVHFKDNGGGIPSEIRDRVFEPFFTTKAGGSGIGLAMASQAVQDCGGSLYLEPSLSAESGAEFVVALPLAAVEAAVTMDVAQDLESWSGVPARWRQPADSDEGGEPADAGLPPHLMSPEGLKAVLALSRKDPEGVN